MRNVGNRTPLKARAAVVAFVLQDHRVEGEHDLSLGQTCEHYYLFATLRVALVRHRAAADLLLRPTHLDLADFPAVQGANFVCYPRQGSGDHRQGADELGDPIARHMPARQWHLQRQPLGKCLQHGHGFSAKGCHRTDTTE
ncbi:hypothetical protein D3C77_519560 [compost metagenome]